jgi:regulator of protease activity HflC (stomatin/prohibitin superfamily)
VEAAFAWLGDLARWLSAWVPRLVHVKATDKGVKFVRAATKLLEPGLHVWWPITTEIMTHPVVRQVVNLPNQTLLTKDGKVVVASGVVVYTISDLHRFLVENYDAEASIAELGLAGIRRAVTQRKFDDLRNGRADTDNRLTEECQRLLDDLGVKVEYARLTDFAPVRAFALLGTGTSPAKAAHEGGNEG